MSRDALHEDLRREHTVPMGSERSFGIVFAVVFLLIGLWPVLWWTAPRIWALVISAAFAAIAFTLPALLRPLNYLWFRFGLVLHRIMSQVILGLLFFVTVTPIAFIYRVLGKDPLRLKFEPESSSYWIVREPPGPPPDTMTKQF
jgi:saxitoxin biosynthesis operon SxtJ-like protein